MNALATRRRRRWLLRHQPLGIRLLAATAVAFAAAAAFAAPAEASPIDDAFIGALDNAGVKDGDVGHEVELGHAVCPMLSEQGGTLASAASSIATQDSLSPEMASTFTSIAISMYCPTVMASAAQGSLSGLPTGATPADEAFIGALNNAGVNYGDAGQAQALGQSVCPIVAEQGGSFASAASSVATQDSLSPQMAATFTSIAISMYCPSAMTNAVQGNWPDLQQIPGVSDLQQIPGLPTF